MAGHDILYLVGHGARQELHLEDLFPVASMQAEAGRNVGIVLMQDGVIGLSSKGLVPEVITDLLGADIHLHSLGPDMTARGMNPDLVIEGIDILDYDTLVDLITDSEKVISIL
jgi:sulfur relay protein TusB/DsrH